MKKVLCFGEALFRISPPAGDNWLREGSASIHLGGAELNVATALAAWGLPVKYCTALPANDLSKEILNILEQRKIDAGSILFSGNRIGIYYLPLGNDLKNTSVIYDRGHSSFAELQPGMLDWEKILEDVSWFHFSAIDPAVSETAAAVCEEALKAAASKKIPVSIDLNYRAKLWQYGKAPVEVMPSLLAYCNVVMGNIWSAHQLLGVENKMTGKATKEQYLEQALQTSAAIRQEFPACRTVANTFRFEAKDGGMLYYAALLKDDSFLESKQFSCDKVLNKIGSGDCFMAGLIFGLMNELPLQQVVDFAASAAFGKMQEPGDATEQELGTIRTRIEL